MIKAVIFDMDGVLTDSQPNYFYADMKTIERCGKTVDLKFTEDYAGLCNKERWAKYKEDLGLDENVDDLIQMNMDIYYEILNTGGIIPVEGAALLVKLLYKNGYQLAVASSSPIEMIEKVVSGLGIVNYFSHLVSGEHMTKSKPDPEIFLTTAQRLGVEPKECLVIEDSYFGITASKGAGMPCVGFCNPNSGKQDLSKADKLIYKFEEINQDLNWLNEF